MIHTRNMNIRTKLMMIMMVTGTTVLLVSMLAMVTTEYKRTHGIIVDEMHTMSSVISWNCGAALAFGDQEAATQTLAALKIKPGIVAAYLYDKEGELFSFFQSPNVSPAAGDSLPFSLSAPQLEALRSSVGPSDITRNGYLQVIAPVTIKGDVVGTLHIINDQSDLRHMVRSVSLVSLSIVFVALILFFILSARLQRIFTEPVRELMVAMQGVSKSKDFTTKVEMKCNDEFGVLAEVFNEMLVEINRRDTKLKDHRQQLEKQVAERTSELTATVRTLEVASREANRAKDEAEAASRAKSEFLATMSHEIRTPMNGVLGMAELLVESNLTGRQAHFAQTIQSSGYSLLGIINDILDLSKIESGMLRIDANDFHLGELLEDVAEMMVEQAEQKGLELILDMPTQARSTVSGDSLRIRQVLVNLIGNAIKFTSKGTVLIQVIPETVAQNHLAFQCRVVDSGIGMAPEVRDLIFEAFTQADGSTTRNFGGTGLGLTISKQLVTLMGGQIGVESREGHGSTFWFRLDLARPEHEAEMINQDRTELAGKTLLVVDDSQVNLEIIAEFAASWNMNTAKASTAREALLALDGGTAAGRRFDAVVLDLLLPDMDGLELARMIRSRENYAETPLIMLSSTHSDVALRELQDQGVNAYLNKPVRKRVLARALIENLNADSPGHEVAAVDRAPRGALFKGRILVAEDNPVNQEVACGMLEMLGLEVVVAEDGEQAVAAVREQVFPLVFMDCHMPGMDGFSAATAIRELEKQNALQSNGKNGRLSIVALTANVQKEVQYQCRSAGMDGYLSKPFTWEQLIAVLNDWLPADCILPESAPETDPPPAEHSPTVEAGDPATMAPETITSATRILDVETLEKLRQLQRPGKPDIVRMAVEKYFLKYDEKCQEILQAIRTGDSCLLTDAAHYLKSSSANLGAAALTDLCRALEVDGRAGMVPGDTELLEYFMDVSAQTRQALEKHAEVKPSVVG